ncbi:hypothetical protein CHINAEXTREME_17160 [Halobiforma lacisalsi AJ5]|uniref:WDGH domain-containing protein n=1 Tax=Natronobacterium lacisalsi AJ5 TaxID=358396 RepID=M0LNP3_NATLA|nr:hypothetical protein [Halobiforma lacisalsi]APW99393.1 hypothetical protein CHINAEXTREME_17160 [Halobiforma lacisalsi AJ5]EMA35172.1 hypothetical protein C445_05618 [Halobiforma lacisalsi AJ5]
MSKDKTLEEVYTDRNLLALTAAEMAVRLQRSLSPPESRYFDGGWYRSEADNTDTGEWAVVYLETPEGQASWHVPIDLARQSHLTELQSRWDGHTRREKNDRLRRFTGLDY